MNIPQRMRLIERLHSEMDEIRHSREEAISRAVELERSREEIARSFEAERRSREEAVSRAELDRQQIRDTARNILKAGQPVEQVVQNTAFPGKWFRPWQPSLINSEEVRSE
jgi:predicted RNA binding protein with dsRBD fold (UPF0201 family)